MGTKKALTNALAVLDPTIDDRTVLLIDVPSGEKVYSYAAIYIAEKNQWYLTGNGSLLDSYYTGTSYLIQHLANYPGTTMRIVTETEVVRG